MDTLFRKTADKSLKILTINEEKIIGSDKNSHLLLHVATFYGNHSVVDEIIEQYPHFLFTRDIYGNSCVEIALLQEQDALVRKFMKYSFYPRVEYTHLGDFEYNYANEIDFIDEEYAMSQSAVDFFIKTIVKMKTTLKSKEKVPYLYAYWLKLLKDELMNLKENRAIKENDQVVSMCLSRGEKGDAFCNSILGVNNNGSLYVLDDF